jgi:hypothetical protein
VLWDEGSILPILGTEAEVFDVWIIPFLLADQVELVVA